MRYQVKIIAANTKAGWLHRLMSGQQERAHPNYNYGSSETLEGAYVLLAAAPFYKGEIVVIEDTDATATGWVAIKRGRVQA